MDNSAVKGEGHEQKKREYYGKQINSEKSENSSWLSNSCLAFSVWKFRAPPPEILYRVSRKFHNHCEERMPGASFSFNPAKAVS